MFCLLGTSAEWQHFDTVGIERKKKNHFSHIQSVTAVNIKHINTEMHFSYPCVSMFLSHVFFFNIIIIIIIF